MLKGKKVVLAITGSIAAYKIPLLARLLIKEGAEIQVIMTPMASDFVTPLTLSTLTGKPVIIEPFDTKTGEWSNHVELGRWADVMVFAPVTANTLGKMANGIADNFLVTAYLSAKCPVFVAPAMDLDMYLHPSTQKSIAVLRSFGNHIIEPQTGELASGLTGPGRMEEPENILSILKEFFRKNLSLEKKKVLITAGPTYEKIDPVRFIGNFSTGKMGFELAGEAASRGAQVTLITGPTSLTISDPLIHRINVMSASEMYEQCLSVFPESDFVIMAAAVADYTIENPDPLKIKKKGENLTLTLTPTQDILKRMGEMKQSGQTLVGFALETDRETENADKKRSSKNLDFIILNSLNDPGAGFGFETNKITIMNQSGVIFQSGLKSKKELASEILNIICEPS